MPVNANRAPSPPDDDDKGDDDADEAGGHTMPPTPPTENPTKHPTLVPTLPSTEKLPERLMCQATGDPHIFPFIGGKFDIHHEGVFTNMEYKEEDNQFIFQSKMTYCRPAQPWSGGLTIKCVFGLALQTSEGVKLETSSKMAHIRYNGKKVTKRLQMLPGRVFLKQVKKRVRMRGMAGITLPGDYEYTITNGKEYYIKLMTQKQYSTFFLSLTKKGRDWFGKAPGICGGGGQSQYVKPPNTDKSDDNKAKLKNGGNVIGYPCQKCVAGLGYVGALCSCHEFLVAPAKQLFAKHLAPGTWEKMGQFKLNQAKMRLEQKKCLLFMIKQPEGSLAWRHPALRAMLISQSNDCALDALTGTAKNHKRFNRAELVDNLCNSAMMLVSKHYPSKTLCTLVGKCHLKTKRCHRWGVGSSTRRRRRI